jgi:hypothetical protein
MEKVLEKEQKQQQQQEQQMVLLQHQQRQQRQHLQHHLQRIRDVEMASYIEASNKNNSLSSMPPPSRCPLQNQFIPINTTPKQHIDDVVAEHQASLRLLQQQQQHQSMMNSSARQLSRRSSLDYFYAARRLSMGIGIGNDNFMLPTDFDDVSVSLRSAGNGVGPDCSDATDNSSKAKRRPSSFELFHALMGSRDDPKSVVAAAAAASRRLSLSSMSLQHKSLMDCSLQSDGDMTHLLLSEYAETADVGDAVLTSSNISNTKANEDQENDENDEGATHQNNDEEDDDKSTSLKIQFDPSIDLPTLKVKIEQFAYAMDQSSKSQQDIHDWDRKMGLKRSHSKTMRLSMRSRKKLRAVMKKEMITIKEFSSSKSS